MQTKPVAKLLVPYAFPFISSKTPILSLNLSRIFNGPLSSAINIDTLNVANASTEKVVKKVVISIIKKREWDLNPYYPAYEADALPIGYLAENKKGIELVIALPLTLLRFGVKI